MLLQMVDWVMGESRKVRVREGEYTFLDGDSGRG
jgi:hypothetical protein